MSKAKFTDYGTPDTWDDSAKAEIAAKLKKVPLAKLKSEISRLALFVTLAQTLKGPRLEQQLAHVQPAYELVENELTARGAM